MFDRNSEIAINLLGGKTVVLRSYPEDSDWAVWRRAHKLTQTPEGAAFQVEDDKPNPSDRNLIRRVQLGDTPVSAEEAFAIAKLLSLADVINEPEPQVDGTIRLEMEFLKRFKSVHTLKAPSTQDLVQYRREFISVVIEARRTQRITISPAVGEALYDRLAVSTEGYSNGVPLPHKIEVINALTQFAERNQEVQHG